ncbi:hypothetical protein CEXT_170381 [Caerostris extrusa]|uniref:Uncharacterized protein n=1 Tax=Caerostris extrusa TaxID=172846 RepID=A0AAV4MBL9_CAEEX|nr:hypothetical protein CEXT_170381 [Caerostris extrusa]
MPQFKIIQNLEGFGCNLILRDLFVKPESSRSCHSSFRAHSEPTFLACRFSLVYSGLAHPRCLNWAKFSGRPTPLGIGDDTFLGIPALELVSFQSPDMNEWT